MSLKPILLIGGTAAACCALSNIDPVMNAAGVAAEPSGQLSDATTCAYQLDHLLTKRLGILRRRARHIGLLIKLKSAREIAVTS